MKTITIEAFKFDELDESVQQKLIEEEIMNNDFDFLSDDMKQELLYKLEENKISPTIQPELYYSLSYSKGDGVCFTGRFKWKGYLISITKSNHMYCHSYTTDICLETNYGRPAKESVVERFTELYHKICKELEVFGYGGIEAENDEEYIKGRLVENDYDYDARGRLL